MTPIFKVVAGDTDITAKIQDRLLSLSTTDEAGVQSDTCDLKLDNRDQAVALPAKGVKLKVSLGYRETGLVKLGTYVVDEVEIGGPPDTLSIKGKAPDMEGDQKAHKERSWDGHTVGGIVGAIAAEYGLTPAVGADLAGITIPHIDQTDESDLHFLTRLAEGFGAVAKPAGDALVFAKKGEAKAVSGQSLTPVVVAAADVASWSMTCADRGKYAAVIATYHDQGEAEKTEVRVGEDEGSAYRLRDSYPTEEAATAAATAKRARLERGELKLSLSLAVGHATAAAEAPLTVTGLHRDVDAVAWLITRATHAFDGQGFKTSLECERKV